MAWLVLLIALLVGLGGGWLAYRSSRRWRTREQRRVARATPLQARVLDVHRGSLPQHRGAAALRLRLLVESTTGRSDREVTVDWEVPLDRVDEVTVGARLPVRVDRFDPDRVHPVMAGAEWMAPARA